jgi:pimeloyl-ACP methyl ester carboxylesterase
MNPEFLTLPDRRLAYQRLRGDAAKAGIIFLGGYASDMTGTKASFLAERCAAANIAYLRFDYRGHGQSEGAFRDGTIGGWLEDATAVFDQLTEGPQVLVGSSLGGWIGLMLARDKAARVKGFVGIAAAPDFTEDLMWLRMTAEQKAQMQRDGEIPDPTAPLGMDVPVTMKLIEEGRKHLMLSKKIKLQCPVHLLQGLNDQEVPWQHAIRITENIAHEDVCTTLIKDGDHRLSRVKDLELMWEVVAGMV